MSEEQAVAFMERVETDEDFAKELESVKTDPPAVLEKIHGAGYDATPDEIREAFLNRYGAELTQEQLDQISAGTDPAVIAGTTVGVVVWVAAASAAVF
jgi:predicted ribosomally synthesized peptide with nif11-like leader